VGAGNKTDRDGEQKSYAAHSIYRETMNSTALKQRIDFWQLGSDLILEISIDNSPCGKRPRAIAQGRTLNLNSEGLLMYVSGISNQDRGFIIPRSSLMRLESALDPRSSHIRKSKLKINLGLFTQSLHRISMGMQLSVMIVTTLDVIPSRCRVFSRMECELMGEEF
jgi:hypothetical protein